MSITPGQFKAARRLLGWSQKTASFSRIGVKTTGKLERGIRPLRETELPIIRAALESAGVVFNADGLGVLLKEQHGGNGSVVPDNLDA